MLNYRYHDGGRSLSGRRGKADDCVCRAIAIASESLYSEVYERLAAGNASEVKVQYRHTVDSTLNFTKYKPRTAREKINTHAEWFKRYMEELGFAWTPTMSIGSGWAIGSGCKVHLRDGELPMGRLVVAVSKHYVAVVDGVVYDTEDPRRDGARCVYGYWQMKEIV